MAFAESHVENFQTKFQIPDRTSFPGVIFGVMKINHDSDPTPALDSAIANECNIKRQYGASMAMIDSWEKRIADEPLFSVRRELHVELAALRIISTRLDIDVYATARTVREEIDSLVG